MSNSQKGTTRQVHGLLAALIFLVSQLMFIPASVAAPAISFTQQSYGVVGSLSFSTNTTYAGESFYVDVPDVCASNAMGVTLHELLYSGPTLLRDRLGGPNRFYVDNSITPGDFSYRISVICGSSTDFPSGITFDAFTFQVHTYVAQPVEAPTNIVLTPHDSSITVSWTPGANTASMNIAANPFENGNQICYSTDISITSCTVGSLTNGSQYAIQIISFGRGPNSNRTTVNTQQITVGEPIHISATVSSAWHVGEVVTATSTVASGSPTGTTFAWYRCASAIPESLTAPSGCSLISSGATDTYTLVSQDIGKYVSAFVTSANSYSSDSKTAFSNHVVMGAPGPITISASISSSWHVGDMVNVTSTVTGNPTTTDIQWYRCDSPVAAMNAQPVCALITGATSAGYTLTGDDLGKYVTAFLHSNNSVSDVMATVANSHVTLAQVVVNNPVPVPAASASASASATPSPTASPGAPTPISGLPTTGTGPVSTPSSAAKKSLVISGYSGSVTKLTLSQKHSVQVFVAASKGYKTLSCSGDIQGLKLSKAATLLASNRAAEVCKYARTLISGLVVTSKGMQSRTSGSLKASVLLSLSK